MNYKLLAKTVLFDEDGNVLVLRRSANDENSPGRVDFPGGGVELGEDYAVAAAREIQEEAGLTFQPEDLRLAYSFTMYDETKDVTFIRLLYVARALDTNVQLSFEHDEFSWRPQEEAVEAFAATSWNEALRFVLAHDILGAAWIE